MAAMKKYKVSRVDAKSDVSCSLGDFCTGVQAATGRPQNVILDIIQQQQALLDVAWLQVFAHLLHTDILCPFPGLWAQCILRPFRCRFDRMQTRDGNYCPEWHRHPHRQWGVRPIEELRRQRGDNRKHHY